jgi:hypothetical protein
VHDRFDTFIKAFLDGLNRHIVAGCKGFKSVIAYGTGVAVEENPDKDAAAPGLAEIRGNPARES